MGMKTPVVVRFPYPFSRRERETWVRNLEVKSLHKKQENLTTEITKIAEIFSKVFSVDSVRSVVKSFLVSACPS
jgi:hypothetical protein